MEKKNGNQDERRNSFSADGNRSNEDHLDTQKVSGNVGDEEDLDDEELTEADFAIDEDDEEDDDFDIS